MKHHKKKVIFFIAIVIILGIIVLFVPVREYIYRPFSPNFPYPTENFVGREKDMETLLQWTNFSNNSAQIINIVGPPGIGKSTLAISLGNEMIKRGEWVYYVNMYEFPERGLKKVLAEKILASLFSPKEKMTSKLNIEFDDLLTWAQNHWGHTVLVLDNCDKCINFQKDSFQEAIKEILDTSRNRIKIVTTSRELTMHIEKFATYKVQPLCEASACELLEHRTPSTLNITEKKLIANLTGKFPLALKIIRALLNAAYDPLSPAEIISSLKKQPIQALSPPELARSMQINASISLSYNHLDEKVRQFSCYLAYFPGSFNASTAIGILTEIANSTSETYELVLKELVVHSLLDCDKNSARYHFHELIKVFFIKSCNSSAGEDFFVAFRMYYSGQLCPMMEHFKVSPQKALAILDAERHNIVLFMNLLKQFRLVEYTDVDVYFQSISCFLDSLFLDYLSCRFTAAELNDTIHSIIQNIEITFDKHYHQLSDQYAVQFEFPQVFKIMENITSYAKRLEQDLKEIKTVFSKNESHTKCFNFTKQTSFPDTREIQLAVAEYRQKIKMIYNNISAYYLENLKLKDTFSLFEESMDIMQNAVDAINYTRTIMISEVNIHTEIADALSETFSVENTERTIQGTKQYRHVIKDFYKWMDVPVPKQFQKYDSLLEIRIREWRKIVGQNGNVYLSNVTQAFLDLVNPSTKGNTMNDYNMTETFTKEMSIIMDMDLLLLYDYKASVFKIVRKLELGEKVYMIYTRHVDNILRLLANAKSSSQSISKVKSNIEALQKTFAVLCGKNKIPGRYIHLVIYLTTLMHNGKEAIEECRTRMLRIETLRHIAGINHDYVAFYQHALMYSEHLDEDEIKLYHSRILDKTERSSLACEISGTETTCNYFDLGKSYLTLGDHKNAIYFFDKASANEEQYSIFHITFMCIRLRQLYHDNMEKKNEVTQKLLDLFEPMQNITSSMVHFQESVFQLYLEFLGEIGEKDKALAIYERIVDSMQELGRKGRLVPLAVSMTETLSKLKFFDRVTKLANYTLHCIEDPESMTYEYIKLSIIKGKAQYLAKNYTEAEELFVVLIDFILANNLTITYSSSFSSVCWYLIALGVFNYGDECFPQLKNIYSMVSNCAYTMFYILLKIPLLEAVHVDQPAHVVKENSQPVELYRPITRLSKETDLWHIMDKDVTVLHTLPRLVLPAINNLMKYLQNIGTAVINNNFFRAIVNSLLNLVRIYVFYVLFSVVKYCTSFVMKCYRIIFMSIIYFSVILVPSYFVYVYVPYMTVHSIPYILLVTHCAITRIISYFIDKFFHDWSFDDMYLLLFYAAMLCDFYAFLLICVIHFVVYFLFWFLKIIIRTFFMKLLF